MFSELGVFRYPCISHSSVVSGRGSPKKCSQGFLELPRGGQTTGKNQGFFVVVSCLFYFHFVSSWSPVVFTYLVVCKCVIHPCFLTFIVMFSFFAVVVFSCFYSSLCLLCSLLFIQLFVFAVFSLGVRKTQTKWENISQFCFHACASVPASPHFHLAQLIILLGPEKNPSKWFIFALFLVLLTMCWNTYFYSAFTHQPNFAYKKGPNKMIMFHKVQNKNRCFRNGLLRKMKTFMFTQTQNLNNEKQR